MNVVSAAVLARSASAFVTIWAGEEASSASASPLKEEEARRRRGGSREGGLERELEFVRRMGRSAAALERSATFEYSPHCVYYLFWWPNTQKLDVGRDTRDSSRRNEKIITRNGCSWSFRLVEDKASSANPNSAARGRCEGPGTPRFC